MSQRFVDDITGKVITEGRSYRLEIYYGDGHDAQDVVDIEDLFTLLRDRLAGDKPSLPLQITIQTWTHGKPKG